MYSPKGNDAVEFRASRHRSTTNDPLDSDMDGVAVASCWGGVLESAGFDWPRAGRDSGANLKLRC